MITMFPMGLWVISLFPASDINAGLLMGVISLSGLVTIAGQMGRDTGKKLQYKLFNKYGKPTIDELSFKGTSFGLDTLQRYHGYLAGLTSTEAPTVFVENESFEECRALYENWTGYLIEATRDKEKFPLVFAENVNFGTRRNLRALKWYGVIITIVSALAVLAFNGCPSCPLDFTLTLPFLWALPPIAKASLLLCILLLWFWLVTVNNKWVMRAGKEYARRLVAATDTVWDRHSKT